ncbi:MAG: DUF4401 domain-containing protein [Desulfobulbaceae bacterium]|jgi:uncharacterized membrane protein|nr:DUF4401 domain-containing protein [Desulfobulbaceae bacterium]
MSENSTPADQPEPSRPSIVPQAIPEGWSKMPAKGCESRPPAASRALSPGALRMMVTGGTLSPSAYEAALRFLGIRPGPRQWSRFWQRMLSSWGVLFFAAGVICFFAYNWAEIHYFFKFTLIGALILVSGLVAVWRGLDSLAGRLALLLASLCVGPLLAVYGQVYQTGADAWELFRVWTLVLLPLAFVGRQAALWLLVWLAGSAWGALYVGTMSLLGLDDAFFGFSGLPEFLLAQVLFLACWEAAAHHWKNKPGYEWLTAAWFPRLIGFALLCALTFALGLMIFDWSRSDSHAYLFLPRESTDVVLYGAILFGGWLWYRRKRPDLFMISCGLFSLATLLVCILIKIDETRWDNVGKLLFWGLVIAGITAGCGWLLRRLHHAMEAEEVAEGSGQVSSSSFWGKLRTHFSWDALWDHLRTVDLLAEDPPPIPAKSATPWYIAVQLAVGGWIAALFLIGFLGFFLYMTLGVRSTPEFPLAMGGIIFLIVARVMMQREAIFTEQFTLAFAIAGTLAVSAAVVLFFEPSHLRRMAPLAVALVIAIIYPFMRNAAYRAIAAVFGLLLFFWGLDFLFWGDIYTHYSRQQLAETGRLSSFMLVRLIMHAAWYIFLCVAMTYGWLAEQRWRPHPRGNGLLTPLLHGIYCVLLVSVVCSGITNRFMDALFDLNPHLMLSGSIWRMLGIGAGIGLLYCAYMMTKAPRITVAVRLFFLGLAVLALVGGWFLPGISVGLLGLALGRYRGDAATLGVTVAALVAYFFCYYYNLNTTLLYKSITLTGTGVGLCAAGICMRMLMKQYPIAYTGGGHA